MKSEDKLIIRAIRGSRIDRYPFWLMRQAGRYLPEYRELRAKAGSFLELCYNSDLAAEVTLQPIRRFNMDAAIVFSDILVIPQALGLDLQFKENEGPVLSPITNVKAIPVFDPQSFFEKLEPVYRTLRVVKQELPLETCLIGFAGAPWTLASYMVQGRSNQSFATVKKWAAMENGGFDKLIDLLVETVTAHLAKQIEAGAEIVQIFDSWAGVLQDHEFYRWVVEPTRAIVAALRVNYPHVPIIGFPRNAGSQYLGYARDTQVDVISLDQDIPLSFAREVLQPLIGLQGNLDPVILAAGGPALETRVSETVAALGRRKYIFNLGHGVIPQTPPEHVARLTEILRSLPIQRSG